VNVARCRDCAKQRPFLVLYHNIPLRFDELTIHRIKCQFSDTLPAIHETPEKAGSIIEEKVRCDLFDSPSNSCFGPDIP